jgi:hypothetical protein
MAQRRGGYQGTFERCNRPGCGCIASKWSVYSWRMLCNNCLSIERAAALAQEQAKAEQDALEQDYADDYETRRDLRAGAVQ